MQDFWFVTLLFNLPPRLFNRSPAGIQLYYCYTHFLEYNYSTFKRTSSVPWPLQNSRHRNKHLGMSSPNTPAGMLSPGRTVSLQRCRSVHAENFNELKRTLNVEVWSDSKANDAVNEKTA